MVSSIGKSVRTLKPIALIVDLQKADFIADYLARCWFESVAFWEDASLLVFVSREAPSRRTKPAQRNSTLAVAQQAGRLVEEDMATIGTFQVSQQWIEPSLHQYAVKEKTVKTSFSLTYYPTLNEKQLYASSLPRIHDEQRLVSRLPPQASHTSTANTTSDRM